MGFLTTFISGIAGNAAQEFANGVFGEVIETAFDKAKTEIVGPSTPRRRETPKNPGIDKPGHSFVRTHIFGEENKPVKLVTWAPSGADLPRTDFNVARFMSNNRSPYRPSSSLATGLLSGPDEYIPGEYRQRRLASAAKVKTLEDVYRELPINAAEQIRVVTLTPGSKDDTLDFKMKRANVWDKNYIALSYRWMGTEDGKMCINGVEVNNVFSNLHCALRHIRASISADTDIWFYALCIHQSHWPEKREQLLLMGELYSNAKHTIVWLGAPNDQSISAMSHFATLVDTTWSSLMATYDQDAEKWLDFGDGVMNREWWGRAWMVQEMVCAKSLFFRCGEQQMDLESFAALINFTYSSGLPFTRQTLPLSPEFHFRWQSFVEMYAARHLWKDRGAISGIAPLDRKIPLLGQHERAGSDPRLSWSCN